MTVDFINTAPGAAMPNLIQLTFNPQPGQVLEKLLFVVNADGTLRAAFACPMARRAAPGRGASRLEPGSL